MLSKLPLENTIFQNRQLLLRKKHLLEPFTFPLAAFMNVIHTAIVCDIDITVHRIFWQKITKKCMVNG